jgi:hypothetical protein
MISCPCSKSRRQEKYGVMKKINRGKENNKEGIKEHRVKEQTK